MIVLEVIEAVLIEQRGKLRERGRGLIAPVSFLFTDDVTERIQIGGLQ